MPFKLNISDKSGKSWKLEIESDYLSGKSIGENAEGKSVKPELEGYEFEITGGSDIAGFPLKRDVEGIGLRKVLFTKGWGMHDKREGVRLRKTVRGKTISSSVVQINLKILKEGSKKLSEIFPEQNNPKEEKSVEKKAEPVTA